MSHWGSIVREENEEITFAHDLLFVFANNSNNNTLVRAVERGAIDIVKYLSLQVLWGAAPAFAAASCGQLEMLTLLHQRGHPWTEAACTVAAEKGNVQCLQYLCENGCVFDSNDLLMVAAEKGHLDCLKFIYQRCLIWPAKIAVEASKRGHLRLLEFAVDHACTLSSEASTIATLNGHVECLEYLITARCPIDDNACTLACQAGQLQCLVVLHKHGSPWNAGTCSCAAEQGHLDCLIYLHENGCPWDFFSTHYAAEQGNLHCLRYTMSQGCPYTDHIIVCAAQAGNLACMEYLVEDQGIFFSDDGCVFMRALLSGHYHILQYIVDHGCPFQICSNSVLQMEVQLFKRNAKSKRIDENLLHGLQIAFTHGWDIERYSETIIRFIASNKKIFPLCHAYLENDNICWFEFI